MSERVKPFHAPKSKVVRGRKHATELQAEIASYLSRDPWVLVVERNNDTKQCGITTRGREPIPDSFSTIFGDAVHNFRSALDLLANDLVALNGVQPHKVYFPFADSREGLEDQIKSKMRGVAPDVAEIVRGLKPYRGGNVMLRALHDFDILDKHIQVIQPIYRTTTPALPMKRLPSTSPGSFKLVADFCALPTDPIDVSAYKDTVPGNVEVIGKVRGSEISVTIGHNLPLSGSDPVETLNKMADLVEGILQTFEAHCLGRK